jgi:hypothetical protein
MLATTDDGGEIDISSMLGESELLGDVLGSCPCIENPTAPCNHEISVPFPAWVMEFLVSFSCFSKGSLERKKVYVSRHMSKGNAARIDAIVTAAEFFQMSDLYDCVGLYIADTINESPDVQDMRNVVDVGSPRERK